MRNSVIPVTQFLPQKSCKKKIRDGSEKCVFKGLQRESSDDKTSQCIEAHGSIEKLWSAAPPVAVPQGSIP